MIGVALLILLAACALCVYAMIAVDSIKKDRALIGKEIIRLQAEINAHDAWVVNLAKMQPTDSHLLIQKTDTFNKAKNHGKS